MHKRRQMDYGFLSNLTEDYQMKTLRIVEILEILHGEILDAMLNVHAMLFEVNEAWVPIVT